MTGITVESVKEFGLSRKDAARAKNMFALGLLPWLYGRPVETTEVFAVSYLVKPAVTPAGTYRNITGNTALSYGLVAAGVRSGLPVFLGAYPITPASDILHELSKHKRFDVTTIQAEDEIAAIGAAWERRTAARSASPRHRDRPGSQGRPAPGNVRSQRRGPRAGPGAQVARRLF